MGLTKLRSMIQMEQQEDDGFDEFAGEVPDVLSHDI